MSRGNKNSEIKARLKFYSLISSIFVALVGFVVLIGWTKDIIILKSVSPDWISMKANTAFCFLLSGLTLIIYNIEKEGSGSHYIAYSFSAIVILIASITLCEYFFNINPGIDEFFFRDKLTAVGTAKPGRLALGSAICFIIFGVSFLFSRFKIINPLIFQWLYLITGVISITALIGYLFKVDQFTGVAQYTTMAFHTSFSFLILMQAALFNNPEVGIMKLISSETSGGKLFRNTFPFILSVILVIGWFRLQGEVAGFYNHNLGVLVFSVLVIILFAFILYKNASVLSKTEESIKKSEIHLRTIIENLPIGLILIDTNFTILEVNNLQSQYTRLVWGKPIANNENLLLAMPLDRRENFIANFNRILEKENTNYIANYTSDTGKLTTLSISLNPVIDANDEVIGACISIEDITERKNSEVKLVQLSQAIEQSPASVVITDTKGNIEYVNRKFTDVTGYTKEEALGKNPRILKSGYTLPNEYESLWQTISSGKEWQGEMQNKKKNGELYWEWASISPIINPNGEIISYIAIKEDITEQKKLEQRFYTAFNSSPSAMSISNVDDRVIIDINISYNEMLGYDRDELIGHTVPSRGLYVNSDERQKIIALIEKNGYVKNRELKVRKKSGEIIDILGSFSTIEVEGRKCLLSTFTDITEQKAAEEAVKKIARQLEEVSSSIPGAVYQFMMKPDGSYFFPFISEGMKDLTGSHYQEILKDTNSAFNYIHPQDLPVIMQTILESATNLSPWLQFFRMMQDNDSYKWIRGNSIPEKLSDGSILWNGTFIDVTEQKLAEESLKNNYSELQKTNKELDSFVYSTSHDLRAPLTSIMGIINLLETEESVEHQKKLVDMIRTSINRLDGFIGDILDYSRNRRTDIVSEEINFEQIIEDILTSLKFKSGMSRLKLIQEMDTKIPFYSDKIRLEIVLKNLISNAIKYQDYDKESSYLKIKIKTTQTNAELIIEDNGIGIDAKHLPNIFDMFYRAAKTSTGSGIGLYIVKENILKLNGTIEAQSELNKKTTITINLPNNIN